MSGRSLEENRKDREISGLILGDTMVRRSESLAGAFESIQAKKVNRLRHNALIVRRRL
jgi:hypothetical protein